MKNTSHLNDLAGLVGSIAGLANDARNGLRDKKKKVRASMKAVDEVAVLKPQIEALTKRVQDLENKAKES